MALSPGNSPPPPDANSNNKDYIAAAHILRSSKLSALQYKGGVGGGGSVCVCVGGGYQYTEAVQCLST